ncbi:MAG: type II toxin-antitoxin system VapC family toxin [Bacteroidota bacterium]
MNGNKALLDSNVIIFASKQQIDIQGLLDRYDHFYTSIITYVETYGYNFKSEIEKELIDELFSNLTIIEVSKDIAEQAILYRKNGKKKIKIPDALILATAKYLGADIITDDWDDFEGIDETVSIIKIDDLKI